MVQKMELPIFQVDAFASRVFGGNPAAVIILEHSWLADDLLQAIAAENNLSETAFVIILYSRPLLGREARQALTLGETALSPRR